MAMVCDLMSELNAHIKCHNEDWNWCEVGAIWKFSNPKLSVSWRFISCWVVLRERR